MVLKYISKDGKLRIHGPPYSKAEKADFYRRNAGGPVTVMRPAGDRKEQKSRAAKKSYRQLQDKP
jgi:hypothetical protein